MSYKNIQVDLSSYISRSEFNAQLQLLYKRCCPKKLICPIRRIPKNNTINDNTTYDYLFLNLKENYIPIFDTTHYKEYISLSMYEKTPNIDKTKFNIISDERYEIVKNNAQQDGYKKRKIYPLLSFLS